MASRVVSLWAYLKTLGNNKGQEWLFDSTLKLSREKQLDTTGLRACISVHDPMEDPNNALIDLNSTMSTVCHSDSVDEIISQI